MDTTRSADPRSILHRIEIMQTELVALRRDATERFIEPNPLTIGELSAVAGHLMAIAGSLGCLHQTFRLWVRHG